jgi:hypothetical protein
MASSRGDTKPCTAVGCTGSMQFGRRGDDARAALVRDRSDVPPAAPDTKGWVCNREPDHFRQDA